jgi:hypothetical protein
MCGRREGLSSVHSSVSHVCAFSHGQTECFVLVSIVIDLMSKYRTARNSRGAGCSKEKILLNAI